MKTVFLIELRLKVLQLLLLSITDLTFLKRRPLDYEMSHGQATHKKDKKIGRKPNYARGRIEINTEKKLRLAYNCMKWRTG